MKIIFDFMPENREMSDMIGKAAREYIATGIFPEDAFIATAELK